MNKLLRVIIVSLLVLLPFNVNALTKTEIIYANLDYSGKVKKTTITNQLSNISKGEVVDYTKLNDIVNASGDEKFTRDGERLTWKSTGKDIYYKGKIEKELPITIKSSYYFNDKSVSPKNINNKKGHVKIVLDFTNNNYDSNTNMYVPFVVDLTTILDDNSTNISITNGAVVSTGTKNVITAVAAPGLYKSTGINEFNGLDSITLEYDTTKYNYNEMYVVCTPKLLDKVDLDKLNKVDELNGSLNLLQDSMNKAVDGADQLVDGDNQLNNGLVELNNGIGQLVEGSNNLSNGLGQVNEGISSFSSLTTMTTNLYNSYVENLTLINTIQNNIDALEQIENPTPEQIATLNTLKEQKAQLLGANQAIAQVLTGLLGVPSMDYVNENTINIFNTKINTLIGGVSELANGSNTLTNGLEKVYDGSNKLVEGSNKLNNGINDLRNGLDRLNKEGINKLSDYGNIAVNYKNKISILSNLSKNYNGFSSDNSSKTTFIYKMSK